MGLYEKWLRLWADKPVLDLVELINNNPELVQTSGFDHYVVGSLRVYFGSYTPSVKFAGEWYGGCNNKLVRRAIATALIKNQEKK